MNRRLALSALAALGIAALSATLPTHAADPTIAGTWDLDVAKSKSTDAMPKSITRSYEVTGSSEKLTGTIITADGKSIPINFTATLDGKDSRFQSPGVDALALTKVDALTVSYVTKLAGKQVATGSRVLSADGRTMTFNQKGLNPAGAPFESTIDRKSVV